jgi:hypothetical protein
MLFMSKDMSLNIERHGFCWRPWAGAGRVLVHLLHVVRAALAGLLLQQALERQPRPHARAVLEEQLGQRLARVSAASGKICGDPVNISGAPRGARL